jgi:hypothetical protein
MSEKEWPPELDTLDQLQGGPLSLSIVRQIFRDESRFAYAIQKMLADGDIQLLDADGIEVPKWQWRNVLEISEGAPKYTFAITDRGAKRIG